MVLGYSFSYGKPEPVAVIRPLSCLIRPIEPFEYSLLITFLYRIPMVNDFENCILPKGFVRIRYYGILSCRCKKDKLTLCRNLLVCKKYLSLLRRKTIEEKIKILYNRDICKCSKCGQPLSSYVVLGQYMLC